MANFHKPTESGTPLRIVFVPSSHFTDFLDYKKRVDTMWTLFTKHVFYRRYLSRISAWFLENPCINDKHPDPTLRDIFVNEVEVLKCVKSRVQQFDPNNGDVIVLIMGKPEKGNVRGTSMLEKKSSQIPYEAVVNWVNMAIGGENAFVHEFSHAFGHLGDEYAGSWVNQGHPEYPNVSENVPGYTCKEKWGDMIGLTFHPHPDLPHVINQYTGQVGCFSNAHATNWSKPTDHSCLMNQCGSEFPFCPVCHRHMEKVIHNYGTGETEVTFERYPDGAWIKQPTLLNGNEFLAYGVALSPDPTHYAATLKTQPAIQLGGYGAQTNCLVMVEQNNIQQHVSRNIHLSFDWPLKEVEITYHGASSRYHLQAFDEKDAIIDTVYQDAVLHGGENKIVINDPRKRIRKVEFGEDRSITVITKLRYR